MFTSKRSVFSKVLVLYALLFLVTASLLWVRHHFFRKNLTGYHEFVIGVSKEKNQYPELSDHQLLNLGWAQHLSNHPTSSYLNFPKEKENGTLRIGVFGDSFVFGAEAEVGFDFSSFLQKKFHRSGFPHI